MSHPHWELNHSNHTYLSGETVNGAAQETAPYVRAADMAIDAVLRSVPLPDGLLMRLDRFVRAMPDESADQVDWLGC